MVLVAALLAEIVGVRPCLRYGFKIPPPYLLQGLLPQYLRPLLRRQGAIRAKGALSLKGIEPRRGPEPIFRNFGGVGVRIDVMPRIVKILRLRYLDNFTH